MQTTNINLNLSLSFSQIVEIVKQLSPGEKSELSEFLFEESLKIAQKDSLMTHYASEKVLSKDWLLKEEDEVWKDL